MLTILNAYSADSRNYKFNFSQLLELTRGDTISAVGTISCNPIALNIGSGVISGQSVTCIISGGTAGQAYTLSVPITLTSGVLKTGKGILYVE